MGLPIELIVDASWPASKVRHLEAAKAFWSAALADDLPAVKVGWDCIQGVRVACSAVHQALGGDLAWASPQKLRPDVGALGTKRLLPATGKLVLDTADALALPDNQLERVLIHELAHALGFGVLWRMKGLVTAAAPSAYIGRCALAEYRSLARTPKSSIPLAPFGEGAAGLHWHEEIFGKELMTSTIREGANPVSRMTLAAFEDLGYTPNYSRAEPYVLQGQNLSAAFAPPLHNHENFQLPQPLDPSAIVPTGRC